MGIGRVWDPTRSFPFGWRLMEVPDIVAPGPPGTKVVPSMATADADGTAVNVRPPTPKVFGGGVCAARLMVLDPTIKFPPVFKLIGVPEIVVPALPATRVAPSTTIDDAEGPAVIVNPPKVRVFAIGV